MRTIKKFKKDKLKLSALKSLYSGAKIYETNSGPYGDVFYDNDEDGKISPGDSICFKDKSIETHDV